MKVRLGDYFKNCLFFTTARLDRQLYRMAEASFAPLALSPSHALILLALREAPPGGISPSALADLFMMDASTITRLVAHLRQRGCVSRHKAGRTVQLAITKGGLKFIPGIQKGWRALYKDYCKKFGEKPANALNAAIVKTLNGSGPKKKTAKTTSRGK